jgi:hypothetical protein
MKKTAPDFRGRFSLPAGPERKHKDDVIHSDAVQRGTVIVIIKRGSSRRRNGAKQ